MNVKRVRQVLIDGLLDLVVHLKDVVNLFRFDGHWRDQLFQIDSSKSSQLRLGAGARQARYALSGGDVSGI